MNYTLDASVAMEWVLPEPDTPKAVRLRNEFRQGLHDLIAPEVFVPEIAHGLTKAERRGVIPTGIAERRMFNIINCLPDLHPSLPAVPRTGCSPK
jgi:predicted nucleic acid-binding protein